MPSTIRLADILGALSVVPDMGFGLPIQQAARASLVATALAREAGCSGEDVSASFYTALLAHIGCISMAHETAEIFGNELAITRAVAMTNLGDPRDIVDTLIPEITRGMTESSAQRTTELVFEHAESFGKHFDTTSAEVARRTACTIGLPEAVQRALYEQPEAWQGGSAPQGLAGEAIALPSRICRIAEDATFFNRLGGPSLATEAVKARAGTLLDPTLVALFVENAPKLLAEAVDEPTVRLLEVEPEPVVEISSDRLADVAAAIGNAADLKSPHTQGHAGETAQVAVAAAEHLGLPDDSFAQVRVAALLHDVGRVAISDAVWEKPGPLTSSEWEEVRMHPYHAERIVSRSEHLAPLARVVGMHHERPDGSGYHRGSRAAEVPMMARLVGVASAWVAMQQTRSHRPALDADGAADELRSEVAEGRLDPQAVDAVLAAAGRGPRPASARPGGLSSREVEVLRLLAAGCSNADIGERLHISRRTAEHHVQHIYTKIGVSTRPGAALFAVENDLLEPIGV